MAALAEQTLVTYQVADHIARITLNRPERRNALNVGAYAELQKGFEEAHRDPEVRCVIVTGADPSFCSGDDVLELMASPEAQARNARPAEDLPAAALQPTPAAMAALSCDKPVIAAVNGAAVGWGMELALFADIRIASDKARFGELFIKRGLVSDVGGFYRLPQVVGPAKAAELLFTGDIIDAAEALRIGLVTQVAPHAELMDAAMALARRIAVNPPLALVAYKQGLRKFAVSDAREAGTWAIGEIRRLMRTADHREGVASFLEKREPVFQGR